MARNLSCSASVASRTSELSILNDEECKRILSVIERDFELRRKEQKRLENIKKEIEQENDRIEYLATSKELGLQRCLRCLKLYRFLINPKETCAICNASVCRECSTYDKQTKLWACKSCIKLKELEGITLNWFYLQSSKKYKRCGSAKVIRELHKREAELDLLGQLPPFTDHDHTVNDIPKSFLNVLQELYHDGRLTSWKVRGRGDILSVRLTWFDPDHRNACIKAKARQHLGSVISYVTYDKNTKRELIEYSTRLNLLVDRLQADLAERNITADQGTLRGKGKDSLKSHQQQIATEITRARVALSGPLRRSNVKTNATHERDLQNLIVQQTEQVLQTSLQQFRKNLAAPNSSIDSKNFDQKLAQNIFDKCVSREIFQELPDVIDSSATTPPPKPNRQSSTTSSLTSLTKPSSIQPTWSNSSPRTSSTSWEIKSRNDNIRKISVSKNSTLEEEDTEKEDEAEREQFTSVASRIQATTESNEVDYGLKLDLSSIDDETSGKNNLRQSIDSDLEAINKSKFSTGEWQTNFTLLESKSSIRSGTETPHSHREAVYVTVPISQHKDSSHRVGDKPLEDLGDDDLYADDESSSYPLPINTTTFAEHSQFSENETSNIKKLFPLPANLLVPNHSSCSFRRPSYTYESDNESLTSSSPSLLEMKPSIDEEKFRMDPNIADPKFILRPRDTITRYGETAKFKTRITGTEPTDIFWFRFGNEDELINNEKYQLSHDDMYHYLKIYSTNKDDEGAYLCVIANDKAQNVDMVKLFVKGNKRAFHVPKVLKEFSDTDIVEGSSLTLKCKLDQGYPKARVLWYKDDVLINPGGHYKLYYYGDGQHALHVDEATIEDDNGTFTCLALNASGRVQITADVFVHEKEVIDVPRNSPVMKKYEKTSNELRSRLNKDQLNMNYERNNDIDPPSISSSVSPLTRSNYSDDENEQYDAKRYIDKFKSERSSKFIEDFPNHYEPVIRSIGSDIDERRSLSQQPFYLNRQPSIEKPIEQRTRSPILQSQPNVNALKSKWEIRLPQLLNSTVGPDRQKRDPTRRHTTNISFQTEQQLQSSMVSLQRQELNPLSQSLSSSQMADNDNHHRPSSPLVKQLKQKFDRLSTNNQTNELNRTHVQSQMIQSKFHRVGNDEMDAACPLLPKDDDDHNYSVEAEVASLTCRGLTSNSGERSSQKARPMLPIRPSPELSIMKSNIATNEPLINRQPIGNTSLPVNVEKQTYKLRTTKSVVKQIIGDGATLVYDSSAEDNMLRTSSPATTSLHHNFYPNHHYQQHRKENVRTETTTQSLKPNINVNNNTTNTKDSLKLTDKQDDSDIAHNSISSNIVNQDNLINSDDDDRNKQQNSISTKDPLNRSISMSDNISNLGKSMPIKANETSHNLILRSSSNVSNRSSTPVGRKSVLARAELWDRRISTTTNENETNQSVPTYDIEQWSNEFEKIQNQKLGEE